MRGACLCGAVRFEVSGPVHSPWACHCSMCRKQSGHHWASATARAADIAITGAPRWYRSSEKVERGFCPACGSFLFWKALGSVDLSFALGAVDGPTGMALERHIFTPDKGDYYDIRDGVPQE